jgi:hypothetical protein
MRGVFPNPVLHVPGRVRGRCAGWCLARFVHDRSQRVADTVELDYGDTSLTAQGLEPVRVRVGPDGLAELVHQDVTAIPVPQLPGPADQRPGGPSACGGMPPCPEGWSGTTRRYSADWGRARGARPGLRDRHPVARTRSHLITRRHVRAGVIATQALPIVDVVRLVEPGRVLDLVPCTVDVHLLLG